MLTGQSRTGRRPVESICPAVDQPSPQFPLLDSLQELSERKWKCCMSIVTTCHSELCWCVWMKRGSGGRCSLALDEQPQTKKKRFSSDFSEPSTGGHCWSDCWGHSLVTCTGHVTNIQVPLSLVSSCLWWPLCWRSWSVSVSAALPSTSLSLSAARPFSSRCCSSSSWPHPFTHGWASPAGSVWWVP